MVANPRSRHSQSQRRQRRRQRRRQPGRGPRGKLENKGTRKLLINMKWTWSPPKLGYWELKDR